MRNCQVRRSCQVGTVANPGPGRCDTGQLWRLFYWNIQNLDQHVAFMVRRDLHRMEHLLHEISELGRKFHGNGVFSVFLSA